MPFTVADLHDLIRLLEEHPDWQTELRRVLLAKDLLDLPRTVQELAAAQRRTEEAITHLTQRLEQGFAEAAAERQGLRQDLTQLSGRVAQGFTEAVGDRQHIRTDMTQGFAEAATDRRELRRDIGQLKGLGQEQFYRDRAPSIFGRLLRQGSDATHQVADLLQDARRTGVISDRDYQDVLAADLLWAGQIRDSHAPIGLVLEASWTVGRNDIERAARRAAVLRRAGLRALPVAAGQEWPPQVHDAGRQSGVAIVQDRTVDQESWDAAVAQA